MVFLSAVSAPVSPNAELERLIGAVADGNTEAFAELYRRTKGAVYALALSVLRSPQDAEDVMQDTFLSLQAGAGSYRAQGTPMAWIMTVCRNHSLKRLQTRKHEPLPEEWELSEARGLSQEERVLLRQLLSSLGEAERQIVALHAAAGFKHREIAAMLGLPLATVLSKYHRAMKKLRKQLEQEDDAR